MQRSTTMLDKVSISIFSHKINGVLGSEHFLHSKCSENEMNIFCVQEHWLHPNYKRVKSINQLRTVHPSFDGYGVSAMRNVHNEAVMKSRPYRGTGFISYEQLSCFPQPM